MFEGRRGTKKGEREKLCRLEEKRNVLVWGRKGGCGGRKVILSCC